MKFRDKIKNKVKQIKQQTLQHTPQILNQGSSTKNIFDQSSIQVNFIGTQYKTQLTQIKITSQWIDDSLFSFIPKKQLKLNCQWFRKTQSNIEEIKQIKGNKYQLSLDDVGTIIQVQAIPECQGLEYQGMPFMKVLGPIVLDPQTQVQVNELYQSQKATFFITYKQLSISILQQQNESTISQGLIKLIANRKLQLHGKRNIMIGNEIIHYQTINEQYPELIMEKGNAQILNVILNGNGDYLSVEFSNNKVRDVFCLLIRKIKTNLQKQLQKEKQNGKEKEKEKEKVGNIIHYNQDNCKIVKNIQSNHNIVSKLSKLLELKRDEVIQQTNQHKKQEAQVIFNQQTVEKQQPESHIENQTKIQQDNSIKIEQIIQKIEQQSEREQINQNNQQKKQAQQNNSQVQMIKSEENVNIEQSHQPQTQINTVICESVCQPQQTHKQNSQKNQHLKNQQAKLNISTKTINILINFQNQKIPIATQTENKIKQQVQILDKVSLKKQKDKLSQELIFYKNQQKLLKQQNLIVKDLNEDLKQKIKSLQEQLIKYYPNNHNNNKSANKLLPHQNQTKQSQNGKKSDNLCNSKSNNQNEITPYQQLQNYLSQSNKLYQQLLGKYNLLLEQKQSLEEDLMKYKVQFEQLEAEKKYLSKKYDSLTNQINTKNTNLVNSAVKSNSSLYSSPTKSSHNLRADEMILSLKSVQSCQQKQPNFNNYIYNFSPQKSKYQHDNLKVEDQLIRLKSQLKQVIEQNNTLKSLTIKDKDKDKRILIFNSSSKTQLKLQIIELKKLANRLTQSLTEKDLIIQNMKLINKQLNNKILQLVNNIKI